MINYKRIYDNIFMTVNEEGIQLKLSNLSMPKATSRKRGSGLPKEYRDYMNRIKKAENQGYVFSNKFITDVMRLAVEYRGKKLNKLQIEFLKSYDLKKLKTIGVSTKEVAKKEVEDKIEEVKQEIDYSKMPDVYINQPSENIPIDNLPTEDDIIKNQLESYIDSLSFNLKQIYKAILSDYSFNDIKEFINKGYLPMWVGDSDAIMTLRASMNVYNKDIQKMIESLYHLYSLEGGLR